MTPSAPGTRLAPPLECDLVMKGGITSGVVYPLAVTELAEVYRLRVGGRVLGRRDRRRRRRLRRARPRRAEASRGWPRSRTTSPRRSTATAAGCSRCSSRSRPMRRLFRLVTAGLGTSGPGGPGRWSAPRSRAWLVWRRCSGPLPGLVARRRSASCSAAPRQWVVPGRRDCCSRGIGLVAGIGVRRVPRRTPDPRRRLRAVLRARPAGRRPHPP